MKIQRTVISDCYTLQPPLHEDQRGSFVKVWNHPIFSRDGLSFEIREAYYTTSHKGVLRGFHFQVPPSDHTKMVFCQQGRVIDFVLDLRKHSETFGTVESFELDGISKCGVYIPRGCAHAFYSLESNSTLLYLLETEYSPDHDGGVLWSSVDLGFDFNNPIISSRDLEFPPFDRFKSPF